MDDAGDRALAVVDLDGVVADVAHRLHHLEGGRRDWGGFFSAAVDDPPHPEGLAVVARLAETCEVVFLTGRPERCRAETEGWLRSHDLGDHRLVMRPEGLRRPAAEVKVELLARLAGGRQVAMVVDDDTTVVSAMAAAGHPTFHATWGTRSDDLHRAQEVEGRT